MTRVDVNTSIAEKLVENNPEDLTKLLDVAEKVCCNQTDVEGNSLSFYFKDNSKLTVTFLEDYVDVETC